MSLNAPRFYLPKADQNSQAKKTAVQTAITGSLISSEPGFMRGHGTQVEDEKLFATVSGVVEKVNKLISVRCLTARYTGEVGDVVIGRITEVGPKRWRVDINSRQDAILLLSAISVPGKQRRKNVSDELNMREYFVENDLMVAEVQQFFQDGSMALHTRSLKYGKLERGVFVRVSPSLIKRTKTAFVKLPIGVDVILGNNGYLWVFHPLNKSEEMEVEKNSTAESELEEGKEEEVEEKNEITNIDLDERDKLAKSQQVSEDIRQKISRVRNVLLALNSRFIAIHPATINLTYEASLPYSIKDLMSPDVVPIITASAMERREF